MVVRRAVKATTVVAAGTRSDASPETSSVRELLRFERLLSELSARFINVQPEQIDDVIVDGLRRIVDTLGIDRSSLTRISPATEELHTTHSWAVADVSPAPAVPGSKAAFRWLVAMGRAGKAVVFSSPDELPPEADAAKRAYGRLGLRSHVAQPLTVAGELLGFLGFGCVRHERVWEAELLPRMRLLAEIFASALARKRANEHVQEGTLRLDAIVRSAMDAIISVDQDQRVVLFNAAAEKMFGCTAAQALGAPFDRFVPERHRAAHRADVANFAGTGETSRQMGRSADMRALRSDGTEFPIEASISQATVAGQRLSTVILRDITERAHAARQVEESLKFERLLAELSAEFIDLPAARFDSAMDDALRRLVEVLDIDRSTLVRVDRSTGRVEITHSFAVASVDPVPRNVPLRESLPWAYAAARAGRMVAFSSLDDLPAEASVDTETYRRLGQTSHVTVPLFAAGEWLGALTFGCVRRERTWPDDLLNRFRLVAQILANAFARRRAQEELDLALGFERLLADMSAAMLRASSLDLDRAIPRVLQAIGESLGADRVTLWNVSATDGHFTLMHSWRGASVPELPGVLRTTDAPWFLDRMLRGEVVRLESTAVLPGETVAQQGARSWFDMQSLLAVPLVVNDAIGAVLSLGTLGTERSWPEALVPRVRLIGEALANLLERDRKAAQLAAARNEAAQFRERLAHLIRVHTVGEMSAALAHEINQPLGAIENYARAAVRRVADPAPDLAKTTELLQKVIGQATRAGEVIARLRGLVKRHDIEPVRIDLARTVEACVSLVRMDCELHDVRIELKHTEALPPIVADEIHVQQVVINLLRNAMDAMSQEHTSASKLITIEMEPGGPNFVVVRIADRGTGIAAGDLERVFESFYSTKPDGLGIGLAICRKLIEAHGGTLWAAANPGGGAVFQFTLPVAAAEDSA